MKSPRIVIQALILIVAGGMVGEDVQAQTKKPLQHLKKENPNELYTSDIQSNDCVGSSESVLDAELTQSRIKRAPGWRYDELYLEVYVSCLKDDLGRGLTFNVFVAFGKTIRAEDDAEPSWVRLYYEPFAYSTLALTGNDGAAQYIRGVVRDKVEEALTDYLKANFDL